MSDGVILQCTRVERLDQSYTSNGSGAVPCVRCKKAVWVCPAAIELARTTGIKPLCDVCQPAIDTGPLANPNGDEAT